VSIPIEKTVETIESYPLLVLQSLCCTILCLMRRTVMKNSHHHVITVGASCVRVMGRTERLSLAYHPYENISREYEGNKNGTEVAPVSKGLTERSPISLPQLWTVIPLQMMSHLSRTGPRYMARIEQTSYLANYPYPIDWCRLYKLL